MAKFKVGDKVKHIKSGTEVYEVIDLVRDNIAIKVRDGTIWYSDIWFNLVEDVNPLTNKPSGGPSAYYDFPFKDWVTVNDMLDYLSEKQWGWRSYIFKDIIKACTRWGSKDGTTHLYDAKKIIYYGARLLMSVADKATLRAYLQELLDDKQFKENNND